MVNSLKAFLRRFLAARSGVLAVAQTAFANILVQAANITSGIITARMLGPEGRGALAAIIMWPQFLSFALTLGLPSATVYWLKCRPELSRSLSGAALLLSLCLGIVATLVGVAVIPFSLHAYPHGTVRSAQYWVAVAPLTLMGITVMALVQSSGAFISYNIYRVASPLSVVGVLLLLRFRGALTYNHAAFAYLLAGAPATLWITVWAWKKCRPTLTAFTTRGKLLLGYGLRAWGVDLLSTVANVADRILVVSLLAPEAMGFYVVAQGAAGMLAVLPAAVVPVTLPQASGRTIGDIVDLTGRAVRSTLLVMIVAALPLLIAGQQLLTLVYGSKFEGAAVVLPFLVVEAILDGTTAVLAQAFLASGFPGTVTVLEGCGLATALPLLYWLVPAFGIRGAGAALMLSTGVRFTLVMISFRLRLNSAPPSMIIGRAEVRLLLQKFRISSPLP